MVFAVNCPSSGTNSFDNFKAAALKIGADLQASAAAASSTPAATSTDSAADSAYTGPWTTADYGTATIAAAPTESVVTETVSLDTAVWTTTYSSYPGSPDATPSALSGSVIKVVVGGANGELTFTPANVQAKPRDVIQFELYVHLPHVLVGTFNGILTALISMTATRRTTPRRSPPSRRLASASRTPPPATWLVLTPACTYLRSVDSRVVIMTDIPCARPKQHARRRQRD